MLIGSAHLAQLGDAAGVDPFGHEDVPGVIEASIMRMQELARYPTFAMARAAEFHPIFEHLFAPLRILAEMNDHLIVLVEESNARAQVG